MYLTIIIISPIIENKNILDDHIFKQTIYNDLIYIFKWFNQFLRFIIHLTQKKASLFIDLYNLRRVNLKSTLYLS